MDFWKPGENGWSNSDPTQRLEQNEMKKEVTVELLGIQDREGEEERVDIRTRGIYCLRENGHYISYEEELEEIPQKVKTLLHISSGVLSMTKRGPVQVKMEFIPGKRTTCMYRTPFGNIPMEIETKCVEVTEEEDRRIAGFRQTPNSTVQMLTACLPLL